MSAILSQAENLVSELQTLMPSAYQQNSLQALLGLFLERQGIPLPEHCKTKSASALSRFLNEYKWPTRQVIKAVRKAAQSANLVPAESRTQTNTTGDTRPDNTGESRVRSKSLKT